MTTVDRPAYSVIGTRPIRPDGVEKVTGKAQYGADIHLPGLIHAKVLRSPHAHARILSIDTTGAENYPGVLAVLTHKDLPTAADKMEELGESAVNLLEVSENILASRKVLYRRPAVAAVAAASPHVAPPPPKFATPGGPPRPPSPSAAKTPARGDGAPPGPPGGPGWPPPVRTSPNSPSRRSGSSTKCSRPSSMCGTPCATMRQS